MRVLVADDTLGSPRLVQPLLQELLAPVLVEVASSLQEALESHFPCLIILGGRFLQLAKEFRDAHPTAYIIGRRPWAHEEPSTFFPWGDELREPLLPLPSLIADWSQRRGDTPPT